MLGIVVSVWLLQVLPPGTPQTAAAREPQICEEAVEGPAFVALDNCRIPIATFPIFRIEKDTNKDKPISLRACRPTWSAACDLLLMPPAWGRGRADRKLLPLPTTPLLIDMSFQGGPDGRATLTAALAVVARSMRYLEFVWRAGGEQSTAPLLTLATETSPVPLGTCAQIKIGTLSVGAQEFDIRSRCAQEVASARGDAQEVVASLDRGQPFVWQTTATTVETIRLDPPNSNISLDLFPSATAEFHVPKLISKRPYLAPATDGAPAPQNGWPTLVTVRGLVRIPPSPAIIAPRQEDVAPGPDILRSVLISTITVIFVAALFLSRTGRMLAGRLFTEGLSGGFAQVRRAAYKLASLFRRSAERSEDAVGTPAPVDAISPAAAPHPAAATPPAAALVAEGPAQQGTATTWADIDAHIRTVIQKEFDYQVPRAMQQMVADMERRLGKPDELRPIDVSREVQLAVGRLLPDLTARTAQAVEKRFAEAAERREGHLISNVLVHRQFAETINRKIQEAKDTWIADAARQLVANLNFELLGAGPPQRRNPSQNRLAIVPEAHSMLRPVEALVALAGAILLEWSRQGGGKRLASLTTPGGHDADVAAWNALHESHDRAYVHGLQEVLITDAPLIKAIGAQLRSEPPAPSILVDIAMQRWNVTLDSTAGAARFAADWADARLPFLQTVIEALPIELKLFDPEGAGLDTALRTVVSALPEISEFGGDPQTASEGASLYFHRLAEELYQAIGWRYFAVRLHRDHLDSPNVDLALRHVGNVHPVDFGRVLTQSGLATRHGVVVRVRQPVVQRYESTTRSDRWTGTLEFCALTAS